MTLRTRRVLFFSAILFFLIITPILVEYARGLRFDFSTWRFVETGGFFFKIHSPTETKILLDEKPVKTTSAFSYFNNAFIQNLTPGEYNIEISKDGYQSWNKRLKIEPQFVTEARDIVLITDDPQLELYSVPDQKIKKMYQSQNGQYLAMVKYNGKNQTSLQLIDLSANKENEAVISKYVSVFDLRDWREDSGKFIFYDNDKNDYVVVNVFDGKTWNLGVALPAQISAKKIEDIRFGTQENIFILTDGFLYVFDNTVRSLTLLKKDIAAIQIKGESVYYLSKIDLSLTRAYFKNKTLIFEQILGRIDLSANPPAGGRIGRPEDSDFLLTVLDSGQIFATDKIMGELFMFLNNKGEFIKIDDNVTKFSLSKDEKKILYQKQNELIAYYLEDIKIQPYKYAGQKEIIIEAPHKILSSQWLKTSEHIFYSFENSVKFIELDDRDNQNIFHIAEMANPEIFYDESSNRLYILSNEKLYAISLVF